MMESESFFNYGNEAFTLTGFKSVFNVVTDENGQNNLVVGIDVNQELHYAFSGEYGLCLTTPFGSIQMKDLLGKFVSLPDNDAEAVFKSTPTLLTQSSTTPVSASPSFFWFMSC